jgi:hypothetical protein
MLSIQLQLLEKTVGGGLIVRAANGYDVQLLTMKGKRLLRQASEYLGEPENKRAAIWDDCSGRC